ncbi:MAG: Hpt domain-containing protein [Hydrogenophilus sp.]|nr:Hpt domain-containing protein [Hydrogenophilus sp.]
MNQQLLQAFLAEARDFLQAIGERLMQLEADPTNPELLTDLFRYVHTLKGNSGLFDLPAMTQLLHAAEDLMDAVRSGRTPFTSTIADLLLDAMDRVGAMLDELETTGTLSPAHTEPVQAHIARLRSLLVAPPAEPSVAPPPKPPPPL